MNKIGLPVLSGIIFIIIFIGIYQEFKEIIPSVDDVPKIALEHKKSVEDYTIELESVLNNENDSKVKNKSGSLSNFEGPQLSIAYLSHHGEIFDAEKQPYFTLNSSTAHFDPDHQDYGLPDVRVELSQPRFVSSIENGVAPKHLEAVKKYLPSISNITPIKRYTKTIKTPEGNYKKEKYDLYLTEFNITIGTKPLRTDPVIDLTREEKREKIFPREWYQHNTFTGSSSKISLNDLNDMREFKNQRYSKLHVVFKLEPNKSAWYINKKDGSQIQASVAIGAIVSKNIQSNIRNDAGYNEAHIIPASPGINVDMYDEPSLKGKFKAHHTLDNTDINIDDSIFDKDIYFRITTNNLGSWDNRVVFFGEDWDDQFTIKFFMPILVKGEFEIALDSQLIPEYKAPQIYYNKFSLLDIIPDWGFDGFGKTISYILIIISILILVLFLPNVFVLLNSVIGRLASLFKAKNT